MESISTPEEPEAKAPKAQSEQVEKGKDPGKTKSRVRLVECGPLLGSQSRPSGRAGNHLQWASTPTGQWMRVFSTTAIVPNRQRDKSRVENNVGLAEFGDAWTEFYSSVDGLPIARGYDRIVYGDHGPYVEFSNHQLCWSTFPVFVEKPEMSFFDEYYTVEGSTMLYAQKRTVVNKPNPPSGPWSAQNNRPEGYANYLIGKFYLACEPNVITVMNRPASKKKRRGKAKEGHETNVEGEADIPEDEECQWWEDGQDQQEGHWPQEQPWTEQDGSWNQEMQWQQPEPWMQGPWKDQEGSQWNGAEWWSAWPMAGETIPDWQYGYYDESQQETYAGSSYVASDGDASSATTSTWPEILKASAKMSLMKRGGFLLVLVLLILITLASTTTKYWTHWLSITVTVGSLLIVDLLFLEENTFVFDPFADVQKM
eukprot:symbB.v1.2.025017.t1/scaffold2407.1/size80004/3